jgi:hypothetical protein
MRVHRRPAATTVAAIGLIVALTAAFAAFAVHWIATIDRGRSTVEVEEARLGLNPQMANNATVLSAALILAVCVLALGVAAGVALRREGARYAAMGMFGVLGVVALAAALGGLTSNPPAPNAVSGLACAVVNAAIVGLMLVPSTAKDFERVEHARRWLVTRGYPLPGAADGTPDR